MARFTRIPETNLAGALGGIAGQSAGTVISTTNLAVEKLQGKLDSICEKISKGNQTGYYELENLEKTVNTLDKNISTVEKTVEGVQKVTTSIQIPITGLKVAVNTIKYLPLPQMYLVTSVSALQADVIQMMSELIAQLEQTILTLNIIVKIILDLLKRLKDLLAKIRKTISGLKASLTVQNLLENPEVSEIDKDTLKRISLVDQDLRTVFEKLAFTLNGRGTDIIWIGNYKAIDTESTVVENQIKAAESGSSINVPVKVTGDWITFIYTEADTKPEKPVSQELIPQGWSDLIPNLRKSKDFWKSKGTVSGLSGKVISWTEPVKVSYPEGIIKVNQIKPKTQTVYVFRLSVEKFNFSKFDLQKANAILLTGSDEAYRLMIKLFQDIDQSSLSPGIKEILCIDINPVEDQTDPESTEEWYISKSGEKYKMEIKASSVSPNIATLRYVEVTDETGTIVYEGSQTFATDSSVLFEETRVRLTQLLG